MMKPRRRMPDVSVANSSVGVLNDQDSRPWKRISGNVRNNYKLAVAAMLILTLLGLTTRRRTSPEATTTYTFPLPTIPDGLQFTHKRDCGDQVHTYEIRDKKVKWSSERTAFAIENRGMSMHCLLARSAERLPPTFSTMVRVSLSDYPPFRNLTFTHSSEGKDMLSPFPPLLFPDSTWESLPGVHDYSLTATKDTVLKAARTNGLPGSRKWRHRRKSKLLWRGSELGANRLELIHNYTSYPKLDIQGIRYNLTKNMGFKLSSNNQVSRAEHCQYRFLLHLNGVDNTRYSSAIKWKMLCGALVFVPTQPHFVEWWNYNIMEPYKHYVPFATHEELLEKFDYYSTQLDEAEVIAKNGMELAMAAFDGFNDYVDRTLIYHATKTPDAADDTTTVPCSLTDRKPVNFTAEYRSLDELRQKYPPSICA